MKECESQRIGRRTVKCCSLGVTGLFQPGNIAQHLHKTKPGKTLASVGDY